MGEFARRSAATTAPAKANTLRTTTMTRDRRTIRLLERGIKARNAGYGFGAIPVKNAGSCRRSGRERATRRAGRVARPFDFPLNRTYRSQFAILCCTEDEIPVRRGLPAATLSNFAAECLAELFEPFISVKNSMYFVAPGAR